MSKVRTIIKGFTSNTRTGYIILKIIESCNGVLYFDGTEYHCLKNRNREKLLPERCLSFKDVETVLPHVASLISKNNNVDLLSQTYIIIDQDFIDCVENYIEKIESTDMDVLLKIFKNKDSIDQRNIVIDRINIGDDMSLLLERNGDSDTYSMVVDGNYSSKIRYVFSNNGCYNLKVFEDSATPTNIKFEYYDNDNKLNTKMAIISNTTIIYNTATIVRI